MIKNDVVSSIDINSSQVSLTDFPTIPAEPAIRLSNYNHRRETCGEQANRLVGACLCGDWLSC